MNESKSNNQIKGILFCEFHPTAGPKISYQVPDDLISKDVFDSINEFIIPKQHLSNTVSTINAFGFKIVGCPVVVSDDARYDRNLFIFNTCLVFDSATQTSRFESTVEKLNLHLKNMETQNAFLSNEDSKENLFNVIKCILDDLNSKGHCRVWLDEQTFIFLRTPSSETSENKAPKVKDHDVPVPVTDFSNYNSKEWDLTTQRVLKAIDGTSISHVLQIASITGCEVNLVKQCVQGLVYYGLINLVPVFLYSSMFRATHRIQTLFEDKALQEECVRFVVRKDARRKPTIHNILALYCGMKPGMQVRDLFQDNPHSPYVDALRLVQFGIMKKFIHNVQPYPIHRNPAKAKKNRELVQMFDGKHSYNDICCKNGITYEYLDLQDETDPNIVVCLK